MELDINFCSFMKLLAFNEILTSDELEILSELIPTKRFAVRC